MNSKLARIKQYKNATAPGTYPGQNRARKFKNRKKHANKYKARGKVKWDG